MPPDETSNLSSGRCCGQRPLIRGCRFFAFLREFIIRHIKDRGLNDERSEKAAACPRRIMAANGSKKQRSVQTIWRQLVRSQHSKPEKAVRLSRQTRERRATRVSRGSGVPWSKHGQNDYPEILKKSPGKRNCQRQWSKIFRRLRRLSKNSKKAHGIGKTAPGSCLKNLVNVPNKIRG